MYNNYINKKIDDGCTFNKHILGGGNNNHKYQLNDILSNSETISLFNDIEYKIFQSNTGLKLLCIPNDDATIISIGMYIRVGSLDENEDELGIAHFLEHMVFKGTKKYPGDTLVERLDDLGTTYNAATSYEYTNYYIHGLPQFQNELLLILLDMYFDPQIPEQTVKTEKKVILEEYKMRNDSKSMKQYLNLLKLMTKEKNTLYGRPVIGTKDSINNITIKDLIRFRKKYNDHNKALITISGKFNIEKIKSYIEHLIQTEWLDKSFHFSDYNNLQKINQKTFITDLQLTTMKPKLKDRYFFGKTDGEQTNISLNFPCWKTFSKKNMYLGIFSSILSDRLYKIIRIENGFAYSVYSTMNIFDSFGIFSINMGVDTNHIFDAIKLTFKELINLLKYGITEHELIKVKNSNLTGMMVDYQNQMSFFSMYTGNVAYNYKIYGPNELIDIYNAIDIQKIKDDIIKTIINPKQLYITIMGSHKPSNTKIISLFNYFNKKINNIVYKK